MTDDRADHDPDDVPTAPSGDPLRDAAVREALAAMRAELAALPTPELPAEVDARWTAALAAEAGRPDHHRETSGRSQARSGRRLGSRRRVAPQRLLTAAVAALLVAGGVGVLTARAGLAPSLTRVELVAVARSAVGTMDVGVFVDPTRRAACLRAVVPPAAGERLLGGRQVVFDDRPGVLLVLATGTRGGLRILTVDPGCGGPHGGALRAQVVVGDAG